MERTHLCGLGRGFCVTQCDKRGAAHAGTRLAERRRLHAHKRGHPARASRERTHATVYNRRLFRGAMRTRRANRTRHSTGAHHRRDKETP
ncbi:hypothetical protein L810_5373 [Burkholderia sp. AU4i]|nr:hypothetical protein L810_5373 [Burkholderia sp. AU4i]